MNEALSLSHAGLSLAAGSLTTLSPCVFPLLPLIVGGALQRNRLAPIAMALGLSTSFVLIGLLVGALGPALGIDSESMRTFGAILLIGFAAALLIPGLGGHFARALAPIANSANTASLRLDADSLGGAFLLGGLLGLVWSPCSGPLLASALTLVASEGGAGRGALILGLFGVGAAIPLLAVAYASRGALERMRGWALASGTGGRKVFAVVVGLAGILILSGADKWIEAQVVDLLPDAWVAVMTKI